MYVLVFVRKVTQCMCLCLSMKWHNIYVRILVRINYVCALVYIHKVTQCLCLYLFVYLYMYVTIISVVVFVHKVTQCLWLGFCDYACSYRLCLCPCLSIKWHSVCDYILVRMDYVCARVYIRKVTQCPSGTTKCTNIQTNIIIVCTNM